MTGDVILLVVGLVMAGFSIPVLGVFGAFVGAYFSKNTGNRYTSTDNTAVGAIIGYIVGILVAGTGLIIAIVQAIDIFVYLTGK